jgi:hypothetical protein
MNSNIDFRTMPTNVPVLCIPRVYPNISESRIRRIFDDLNMGVLERIDIVPKVTGVNSSKRSSNSNSNSSSSSNKHNVNKGEKFNRVFVHFRCWNDTENANTARERLLNGKEIKIIYDDPWFWKISAYREANKRSSKAALQFDSDEDKDSNLTSYRESIATTRRHTPDDSRPRTPPKEKVFDNSYESL